MSVGILLFFGFSSMAQDTCSQQQLILNSPCECLTYKEISLYIMIVYARVKCIRLSLLLRPQCNGVSDRRVQGRSLTTRTQTRINDTVSSFYVYVRVDDYYIHTWPRIRKSVFLYVQKLSTYIHDRSYSYLYIYIYYIYSYISTFINKPIHNAGIYERFCNVLWGFGKIYIDRLIIFFQVYYPVLRLCQIIACMNHIIARTV